MTLIVVAVVGLEIVRSRFVKETAAETSRAEYSPHSSLLFYNMNVVLVVVETVAETVVVGVVGVVEKEVAYFVVVAVGGKYHFEIKIEA